MKPNPGRKMNDGIIRKKKIKRTSLKSRSFDHGSTPIKKVIPTTNQRNTKKLSSISMKKRKSQPVSPVLGDYSREAIPDLELKKSFYTPPIRKTESSKSKLNTIFKKIVFHKNSIGLFFRVIFVFGFLFFYFHNNPVTTAHIDPHIEYQTIAVSTTLQRSPQLSELGFDIIAITDKQSVSISAEGQESITEKASGSITIFNNFSTEPQRLLPNTRFESASGKIFLLGDTEIIVPGKTLESPGQITAVVYAQNPGQEYNIDITDFSIPGYRELGLEEKFNTMYAVSNTQFTGGFIGTRSVVTEQQQQQSEKDIRGILSQRLVSRLSREKTDRVLLIRNTPYIQYSEPLVTFNNDSQTAVLEQEATIIAAIVSKESLELYINSNYSNTSTEESTRVIANNLVVTALLQSNADYLNTNILNVDISGNVLLEWILPVDTIKVDMLDKTNSDVMSYLKNNNAIDRAYIKNRPFWRNRTSDSIETFLINNNKT